MQKSEAAVEQQLAGLQARLDELQQRAAVLAQDLGDDPGPCPDATRCEESLTRIGAAIASLGNVNLAAEDELRELEGRRGNLLAQVEDVESALHRLAEAMAAMDLETTVRFRDTLDKVNQALQELFAVFLAVDRRNSVWLARMFWKLDWCCVPSLRASVTPLCSSFPVAKRHSPPSRWCLPCST